MARIVNEMRASLQPWYLETLIIGQPILLWGSTARAQGKDRCALRYRARVRPGYSVQADAEACAATFSRMRSRSKLPSRASIPLPSWVKAPYL